MIKSKYRISFFEQLGESQQDIVVKIQEDTEAINRNWENPEALSTILLRLSLRHTELGDLVTESEFEMERNKSDYEYFVDRRKLELTKGGESATSAESQAKVEFKDAKDIYLESKRKYGLLKRKRESLDRVIDTGRSRLSLIKGDMVRS